jgi:lipoate-protein ligase A
MDCRLLIDPPGPGAWNMALDEVLLEQAGRQPALCWRFYGWTEPTLSLGYFQASGDRSRHSASRQCPLVRRLTGGGAILHDQEITYSLAVPAENRLARGRDQLYRLVHSALVATLADFSVAATLCAPTAPNGEEPFLCFQRRASGDVLIGSVKIAGSAQRRRRGAVLQHGSVLLRRSTAAPELPGLEDLRGKPIVREEFLPAWLHRLAHALDLHFLSAVVLEQEKQAAHEIVAQRYSQSSWNALR